jgi:replication initiation protein RepC
MKDSGNGKRYGFRGERGEIVEAYGFDLSPLAVRWDEFADLAAARGVENARRRQLRLKVGELRREIRTVCADALDRDYVGFDWQGAIDRASGRLPRSPTLPDLESLEAQFLKLLAAVDEAWLAAREGEDSKPRGTSDGAHKEPTTEPPAERATYAAFREGVVADRPSPIGAGDEDGPPVRFDEEVLPLSLVLEAVPEIHPLLDDPATAEWEELVQAAYQATSLLGINLSAWREAREAMGRNRAAIAIATILARWKDGEIKSSAGGYLRAMCERERIGALHLMPSLFGLRDRHKPRRKRPGAET